MKHGCNYTGTLVQVVISCCLLFAAYSVLTSRVHIFVSPTWPWPSSSTAVPTIKLLHSPKQAPARGGWISERVGYTMKSPRTPTASGVSLKFNRLKNGPRTPSANRLAPSAAAAARSTKAAQQAAPFSQSTRAWRSGGDRKIMFDNRGERETAGTRAFLSSIWWCGEVVIWQFVNKCLLCDVV